MDIQFAYNLERMLYYIFNEDSVKIKYIMETIEQNYNNHHIFDHNNNDKDSLVYDMKEGYQLSTDDIAKIQDIFISYSVSDEQTLDTIEDMNHKYQFLLCPHSATAVLYYTYFYIYILYK